MVLSVLHLEQNKTGEKTDLFCLSSVQSISKYK